MIHDQFLVPIACPNASAGDTLTTTTVVPTSVSALPGTSTQQYITPQQQPVCTAAQAPCNHVATAPHCPVPCNQHQQPQQQTTHQVQAATQTPQATQTVNGDSKKTKTNGDGIKFKKGRVMRHQNQTQQGTIFSQNQNYQIDHNSGMF